MPAVPQEDIAVPTIEKGDEDPTSEPAVQNTGENADVANGGSQVSCHVA